MKYLIVYQVEGEQLPRNMETVIGHKHRYGDGSIDCISVSNYIRDVVKIDWSKKIVLLNIIPLNQ